MSIVESAAVIGLGLIGGSVARDLHARGVRVAAYDANPEFLDAACRDGIVQHAIDPSMHGIEDVQLVVIAVPVDAAVDVLRCVSTRAERARLVTDVGSTKSRIADAANTLGLGARFVGSHPMAGDHRSGWAASRTGLFDGATVYLCPSMDASPPARDLAREFWESLGALPTQIAPDEHDRKLAWASHLPHVVAAALALAMRRGQVGRQELGPGGRDVTRLAGSSPELWTAIARENADALDEALAAAQNELAAFRAALAQSDSAELRHRFAAARQWFDE